MRVRVGVRWLTAEAAQIEDRVTDELSWSVESDVAAAIAVEDLDAAGGQVFGWGENVGRLGVSAEGDDGWVLEQEKKIGDLAGLTQIDEFLLETEAVGVGDGSEANNGDHGLILAFDGVIDEGGRRGRPRLYFADGAVGRWSVVDGGKSEGHGIRLRCRPLCGSL